MLARRSPPRRGRARAAGRGAARCRRRRGTPPSRPELFPARISRLAEREEQLAARPLVARVRQVERVERRLVEARGLLVGEERERAIAGAPGVAQALVEVAAGDGVVRELGEVGSRLVAVERLERLDRQPVQPDAAGGREPLVERVADEDVGEAKTTAAAGNVGDDAGGHRLVEHVEQLVLRDAGQARERVERELAAEHRREHEQHGCTRPRGG